MYRITKCLSVGTYPRPEDAARLRAAGITHVLNVSDRPSAVSTDDGFADVVFVPMSDSLELSRETTVQALDALHGLASAPGAHVYVHCLMGQFRSPTILWLYLIALGLPEDGARDLITRRAPNAAPGHPAMVTHKHVQHAREHGRAQYVRHPRAETIVSEDA
ncbi:MAG: hypothetical protein ACKODX_11420 [Gemmata sp.]|jgi:hypothetical protein